MATEKNITVQRGRRYAFSGSITQDGSGFDLTGYTLKFQAKFDKDQASLDIDKALTPDADQVTNPGDYTGVLAPADTKDLSYDLYYYEINVFDGTGNYIYTPVYGKIDFTEMVNNTPS